MFLGGQLNPSREKLEAVQGKGEYSLTGGARDPVEEKKKRTKGGGRDPVRKGLGTEGTNQARGLGKGEIGRRKEGGATRRKTWNR